MLSQEAKFRVQELRADARKLTYIAKHLRRQAEEIISEDKFMEKAEKARLNFYSKKAQVDNTMILTPLIENDPLFKEEK